MYEFNPDMRPLCMDGPVRGVDWKQETEVIRAKELGGACVMTVRIGCIRVVVEHVDVVSPANK